MMGTYSINTLQSKNFEHSYNRKFPVGLGEGSGQAGSLARGATPRTRGRRTPAKTARASAGTSRLSS
eukprot:213747-Chlamydomonas_euryale.AAC.1